MKQLQFDGDKSVWKIVVAPHVDDDNVEHITVDVIEQPHDKSGWKAISVDLDSNNAREVAALLISAADYVDA